MFLLAMLACMLPSAGYAQIVQKLIAGNQGRTIERALAEGKSVLVARKTMFDPLVGFQSGSIFGGDYRPPLTYWIRRGTQEQLVLGSSTSEEGRGKILTGAYHFFIIEPGYYDLVGYVEKTSHMGSSDFHKASEPIRSAIGFVNFSTTTLPMLHKYKAWVRPAGGDTFDGHTITRWYSPGYYEDRVDLNSTDAILIDMRGVAPYAEDGSSNLASFLIGPGHIAVIGDFQMGFSHGDCDSPAKGQWVCALESMSLAMPFVPQHADVQAHMSEAGYKPALVSKLETAMLLPGQFFSGQRMRQAPGLRTTDGKPYALFRNTSTRIEHAARKGKPD
jgi:hypothetical protein